FSAFRPWGECAILPPPLISLLPLSSNFAVSTTFTISLLSFRLLAPLEQVPELASTVVSILPRRHSVSHTK
ncbi:hypothetical protein N7449_011792, partial [Penicillium cf. viridicatum]